jgi:hypothetical protein
LANDHDRFNIYKSGYCRGTDRIPKIDLKAGRIEEGASDDCDNKYPTKVFTLRHVMAFRIGLKNDDSSMAAKGNILVSASNMKDALSENKGQGIKEVELPPHADEEIDIPLET